ncbi:MAG: TetR/AcrR family transcriptional regulator [Betaproteobacteria bacterium]|nr:TetR/AcrR family transcriptional regulator [Betaproteobacteria bacterium]
MMSPNKMPRGRPQTFDREKTLQTAVNSYWADGVEKVSINDICKRAGISKPGLYREFQSEDGLKSASLEAYRKIICVPFFEILKKDQPFIDGLEEVLEFFNREKRYVHLRDCPEGCLHLDMFHSRLDFGTATAKKIDDLNKEYFEQLHNWVDRAKDLGEIQEIADTASLVAFISAQFRSALCFRKTGAASEEIEKFLRLGFRVLIK